MKRENEKTPNTGKNLHSTIAWFYCNDFLLHKEIKSRHENTRKYKKTWFFAVYVDASPGCNKIGVRIGEATASR